MAEEVKKTFEDNWSIITDGIEIVEPSCGKYIVQYQGKRAEIRIPSVDTRVYPFGRFKQHLAEKGILEEYAEQFNESMGEYACPDLINWPGIIIEPNGDINLCASFEAINCKSGIVSNIFNRPYEKELMSLHEKEKSWFRDNLGGIVDGKVSMCKLKNGLSGMSHQKARAALRLLRILSEELSDEDPTEEEWEEIRQQAIAENIKPPGLPDEVIKGLAEANNMTFEEMKAKMKT